MPYALTQEPQPFGPSPTDDSFHDIIDVVGVAVPLALAVLLLAVSWPNIKRWLRHRIRGRRRHHRSASRAVPAGPNDSRGPGAIRAPDTPSAPPARTATRETASRGPAT